MDMGSIFERFAPTDPDIIDQKIVLDGVTWIEFLAIARKRDAAGRRGLRLHYLDGSLELMAVSYPHEYIKTTLARCLELWAVLTDVHLEGLGGYTIRKRARRRAAEPDECYYLGTPSEARPPDLAIEVIWTHGGLDKLEVYRGLGVREVWIWENNRIDVHVFERGRWVRRADSKVLPDVDLDLIERCVREGTQEKAIRLLRSALKH